MGSRPTKGQKAQSIIDKEKRNRDTVKKRLIWIRKIDNEALKLPENFNALTLSTFCNYENADLGFTKLSTNTFKTHLAKLEKTTANNSDLLLEVKDIFTSLRRNKKSPKKVAPRTSKNENTKKNYQETIIKLKKNRATLADDLLTLRIGYLNLLETLESCQTKSKVIQTAIKVHRKELGLRLVPNYDE